MFPIQFTMQPCLHPCRSLYRKIHRDACARVVGHGHAAHATSHATIQCTSLCMHVLLPVVGKSTVLRVRKRPGMEAEDVLAAAGEKLQGASGFSNADEDDDLSDYSYGEDGGTGVSFGGQGGGRETGQR